MQSSIHGNGRTFCSTTLPGNAKPPQDPYRETHGERILKKACTASLPQKVFDILTQIAFFVVQ